MSYIPVSSSWLSPGAFVQITEWVPTSYDCAPSDVAENVFMKTFLIAICLLALNAAAAAQQLGAVVAPGGKSYAEGYNTGVAEAERELRDGSATLYIYGLRRSPEFLDRSTGIPFEIIGDCVIDVETKGRADGHNGAIRKYVKERGLPSNSFKRWEEELFDLAGYYKLRAKRTNLTV